MPLSRQRFIDGGTSAAGPGKATAPFSTIADFIASRPLGVSALDSAANYVGWLMPCLNGYAEDVNFPPYVSTELRADSFSPADASSGGTVVDGNLAWANLGGSSKGPVATLILHNISCTGNLTVTDDVNAPPSAIIFSGDEQPDSSCSIGAIDCRATVNLQEVFCYNTVIRSSINADNTRSDAAIVVLVNCSVGNEAGISCKSFGAIDCDISATSISVFASAEFEGCSFRLGSAPTIMGPIATFDGTSWNSFVEAGGMRATGTVVLVKGGANGALVEGVPLSTGGLASVSVSIDGSGATAGFTGEYCGNHYSTASVTQTSVTLLTGGSLNVGDTMLITRTAVVASNLAVINGGAGAGTIGTIPTATKGNVLARFDGTNWVFISGGSLAA